MDHKASDSGERLLLVLGEHWIKYIFPSFLYIVQFCVSVFLFLLAGYTAYHSVWISNAAFLVGLLLMLLSHHWFFWRLLGDAADCIVITNQRSIHFEVQLLFHDEMRENSLDKMRTVEASKEGLLQNIFQYGTLRFQGGLDIPLVPHPHRVARDIEQAMGRR